MGTTTTRVGLYKPLSDGSELVNVSQDLNGNTDLLDLAVGFQAVTSTTRPSSPYSGKPIMETDTGYRTYFSNGTSPASASWVEIPNSSAIYQGRFITLYPGTSSASSLMRLAQTGAAAASRALATRGSGDTADHFFIDFDGKHQWGAGGAASADVTLYRDSANVLKTDDALIVTGALSTLSTLAVSGAATFTGAVTHGGIWYANDFTGVRTINTTATFLDYTGAPSVSTTVPSTGRLLVRWGGRMFNNNTTASSARLGPAMTGGNTVTPTTNDTGTCHIVIGSTTATTPMPAVAEKLYTGLTPGATTVKLQAYISSGSSATCTFNDSWLTVEAV